MRPVATTLFAAALPGVGVMLLAWYGTQLNDALNILPTWQSAGLLVIAGAVMCGTALLPTHAVSLAAGFLLGPLLGPVMAWLAIMSGAVICYSAGQMLAGASLAQAWQASPRFAPLHAALISASPRRTTWLIALLRLSPLAPFAATNVALAALDTPRSWFLLGSALGLAPRVVIVALLGAGMAVLDFNSPQTPLLVILGVAGTLATLIVIGRIAQRTLRQQQIAATT